MIYVTSNKDRFCLNCSFAKFIGDRFFCPFIEGSCIRVPGTVKRPNQDKIDAHMSANGYFRINDNEGRKI